MEKSEKESLAKKFIEILDEWDKNPNNKKDGFEYERSFAQMMRNFEHEVFQKSVGDLPKARDSKKK